MNYPASLQATIEPAADSAGFDAKQAPLRGDRPLRVALFSGNYNYVRDGANQALNRLVGYLLAKGGAQVRIYSPVSAHPAFEPVGDLVPVPSVPIPGRSEFRFALGMPRRVRDDVARFAPDLVHLSAPDWLGHAALRFARESGIPVVASLHTRFETYLEHYGLARLRAATEALLARFYDRCDHVVVPNRAILEEFTDAGFGDRVSLWGRGVDRALFHPRLRDDEWRRSLGYGKGDVVPLFFGRLVKEKGIDCFVAAIEAIRARGHMVRPLIVGDGPQRADFAARLPNATFLGHLSGAALGRAVASADILLNPSASEAFGNVTLESMASGLAMVAADLPSARCLTGDGACALLVRPGDITGYADALELLIRDPLRRAAMAARALDASMAYDWDDVCADVVAAYRKALAPSSAFADDRLLMLAPA